MRKTGLVFLLFFVLTIACSGQTLNQEELNKKIDSTLYYYYNGKTVEAKKNAQEMIDTYPRDPFLRELMAEIIWQELDKAVAPGQPKNKKADYAAVLKNQHLVGRFYQEIQNGLWFAQEELNKNPQDPKNIFLKGMLLIRLGGFVAKFGDGLRSYAEADKKTAEGIDLLQRSIELDPRLCTAKALFALAKHSLIQSADDSFWNRLAIMFKSKTYEALGGNLHAPQVFRWLDESFACDPDYYWIKDVRIDRKFIYQDILIKQAGKMDARILAVLEELNNLFPDNTIVRDNLFLARRHLKK